MTIHFVMSALEWVPQNRGSFDHSCRSTSNVYGKSWREERVDAVARAVEAGSVAAHNADKEAKKDQPESFSNECAGSAT
jgi:hypothetical protein